MQYGVDVHAVASRIFNQESPKLVDKDKLPKRRAEL